jgi:hypothetical protein
MVLSGSLSIRAGREEPVPVPAGSTALIPASLVAQSSALGKAGTRVLVVTLR